MDLDSYIAKYGPEWERLDQVCRRGPRGLAKLSGREIQETVRLYLRASAHLAEVQTRYGDPHLRAYLNGVVARAHGTLYAARARSLRGGLELFGSRYRSAVRRTLPFIAVAAVVLTAIVVATTIWLATSPDAQQGILPPYAREAVRRATGGRADAGISSAGLSAFILANNIQVAFLAFALGITFGIGTIYLVIQNALLLGMLAGAFTAAGKAGIFWSLVLPHGLLELTAIALSAGAGLRMGWSLIDPGDRPRGRALADESRDAALVVVGVLPAFGIAAIIEGFLTGTSVPDPVEIGVGVAVAAGYSAVLFGWARVPGRRSKPPGGLDPQVLVGETPGEPFGRLVHHEGAHTGESGRDAVPP